jgi:hypothetical protein
MKSTAGLIKNHVDFRLNIFGSAEGGLLAGDAILRPKCEFAHVEAVADETANSEDE